ncbi:hypothetical protein PIB30_083717 [Stylosanthes scabra]|uniref:Uncharacterized protein n=1 Tax=Stylosanthes scabra TaxID=79078 RepID=A0ABU6URT0_9FABA|nr:hypothetical protein [Stylosanthes scabra]
MISPSRRRPTRGAIWMLQSTLWGTDYNLPAVNATTRVRLAVDLVLGKHNPVRTDICRMAVDD